MCLVRDQKKRWGIEDLLGDKFLRGEDDERFVGISVDEIRSLIEQTLGFGRMSGGNGLSKETIETLAKVSPHTTLYVGFGSLWVCEDGG